MNLNKEKIITQLRKAKKKTIQMSEMASKKNEIFSKNDWEKKTQYLSKRIEYFTQRKEGVYFSRRVFISYSKSSGSPYYYLLETALQKEGFEVLNGFQTNRNNDGTVLKNVLNQIKISTIYVGILTREQKLDISDEDGNCFTPSIWTMEEKGMALGLGKPFVLLIQYGIHKHYWTKTSPNKIHAFFNDFDDFKFKLEEIVETICQRYDLYVYQKGRDTRGF